MNTDNQENTIQLGFEGTQNFDAASEREYTILNGHNLGSRTMLLCLPMSEFYEKSAVANQQNIADLKRFSGEAVAQRRLDPNHTLGLAKYILKGLFAALETFYLKKAQTPTSTFVELRKAVGVQPYLSLQPLVANIRACKPGGADLKVSRNPGGKVSVFLTGQHVLWVVDGQHRREALRLVNEFLTDVTSRYIYPKRPALFSDLARGESVQPAELAVWNDLHEVARSISTVMVEVHLGLNAEQERQLFFDLNNYSKKVESALAYNFDQSNPINLYIKEKLEGGGVLKLADKDKNEWDNHDGSITRKDAVAVNAILFLNKTNIKTASPEKVSSLTKDADRFWSLVQHIPHFGEPGAKKKTVAAQPVVLKALAKLFHQFRSAEDLQSLQKLIEGIENGKMDFSHSNQIWRYYLLEKQDRESAFPGLESYLPQESEGNRDIGGFNSSDGVFRFGAKHNDIFPILADMIRWTLRLPNRHAVLP